MIDRETVETVAKLAKLNFEGEELDAFVSQFERIVKFVEKINELNTENVPPSTHPIDIKNVFRKDETLVSESVNASLENAPSKKDRFFSVPRVID